MPPSIPNHISMFHTSASGQPGRMPGMNPNPYSYNLRMNAPPAGPFGHPQQQPHQQHPGHQGHPGGHPGNYQNHQHPMSNSAASSMPSNQQYGLSHVQSASPGNNSASAVPKNCSEHWASQMQLRQITRENSIPHAHARANNTHGKQLGAALNGSQSDADKEERNRNHGFPVDPQRSRPPFAELDLGGQNLRNLSLSLFNYKFLNKLWLGHNKLTHLPPSIGLLRNLTHLDLSCNQLHDLPAEIGMLSSLEELLLFDNNIESLPPQVGYLSQLSMIGLEGNPLEDNIKTIIVEKDSQTLIKYLRENAPVPLPPRRREWHVLNDTSLSPSQKLTVFTFNSLCDRYATQSQYGYTPSEALKWEYRKDLILAQIVEGNPDIICLQEIDAKNFREFFTPELQERGYEGLHWPKSRAKTMADREASLVDGCATFWRTDKYILLDKEIIDFANLAINRPDMKGEHDVFNRVMPRDDIAIVTFLEDRMTGTRMMVANAHIFWNQSFKDVKVIQVAIMMERIATLSTKWARKPSLDPESKKLPRKEGDDEADDEMPARSQEYLKGPHIPLIVCGDFNSTPDSGVYALISQGELSHQHEDLMSRKYGSFTRDGLTHPFTMKSSYNQVGELAFTNYTPNFVGVIDYIWYSTNAFQVSGLLGDVDQTHVSRVPGFPHYHFPSDHIPLMAELVTRPRNESMELV